MSRGYCALFLILDGMQPSAEQRRAWRSGALANVRYLLFSSCFYGHLVLYWKFNKLHETQYTGDSL